VSVSVGVSEEGRGRKGKVREGCVCVCVCVRKEGRDGRGESSGSWKETRDIKNTNEH
jgi:hypothetical protein